MKFLMAALFSFGLIQLATLLDDRVQSSKPRTLYVPPPKHIQHMAFGFDDSMADSLWLRLIQDMYACPESTISPSEFDSKEPTSGQVLEENIVNILQAQETRMLCRRGWAFKMLDAITDLAPRFRMPYALGGVTLSVLANDYEGAKVIFDKAVKQFPDDWRIIYRAAYHYLYDLKDPSQAAKLMHQAGEAGAPPWVKSLAARLYTQAGQAELGIQVLKEYLQATEDPTDRREIEERIRRLRSIVGRSSSIKEN